MWDNDNVNIGHDYQISGWHNIEIKVFFGDILMHIPFCTHTHKLNK